MGGQSGEFSLGVRQRLECVDRRIREEFRGCDRELPDIGADIDDRPWLQAPMPEDREHPIRGEREEGPSNEGRDRLGILEEQQALLEESHHVERMPPWWPGKDKTCRIAGSITVARHRPDSG